MTRLTALLSGAAAALLMLPSQPAVASPRPQTHVTGAYVYFTSATGAARKFQSGTDWFTFRTDRALAPAHVAVKIAGQDAYPFVISTRLHCYGAVADVARGDRGLPGGRVLVTLGQRPVIYSRRLLVQRLRAGLPRGAALGCGADSASRVELFNLTEVPEVEPGSYFLTADAGPYVRDISWTGWGTERAVGTGTFVNDCAICGPRAITGATLILEHPVPCPTVGGLVYRVGRLRRVSAGRARLPPIDTGYPCT